MSKYKIMPSILKRLQIRQVDQIQTLATNVEMILPVGYDPKLYKLSFLRLSKA